MPNRQDESPFATVPEAIQDYKDGKFVIIVDDEERENEGDLCMASEFVTPEAVTFMAREGCGLICVPMLGNRLDELKLPMMVRENTSGFGTAFTVTVDATAKHGVTTGISAHDRAKTIEVLISADARPDDLSRPGHILPLRYADGGVLRRTGQTEASVDLAKLAGLYPAAVICEIMNEDGTMSRLPELEQFAEQHEIKIISVASLIEYRRRTEKLIRKIAQTTLPTDFGTWSLHIYESVVDDKHHLALVQGDLSGDTVPLVRAHSECLTGDVFGSQRCDCGPQLREAAERIRKVGAAVVHQSREAAEGIAKLGGYLLYLRQEGRGIGLYAKLDAYALQDAGLDTYEANRALGFGDDERDYTAAAQMLTTLGAGRIRLLSNNPDKAVQLDALGVRVT